MVIHWWGYNSPVIGVDDANIYFVYMRNFAEGHGFVWNIGGEHVEGFTSLIWTLFGALAYRIAPGSFNFILLATNFVLIFFTLRSVLLFSRRLNGMEKQRLHAIEVVIVALLLLPLGFVEWNVLALMETGLWTFLLTHLTLHVAALFMEPNRFSLGKFLVMLILLDLTRPESLVMSLVFVVLVFGVLSVRHRAYAVKVAATSLFTHLSVVVGLFLWRLSYFGYPFPNTYYAKVSGSVMDNIQSGVRYLFIFFYSYPHAALLTVLLCVFAGVTVNRLVSRGVPLVVEEKVLGVVMCVLLIGLMLPVLTGGDHFKYSRFYQPYLPLLYVVGTSLFLWRRYLGVSLQRREVPISLLVAPLVFASLFFSKFTVFDFFKGSGSVNYNILNDFSLAQNARHLGDRLNETFSVLDEYPSLGALATGSIGYCYSGKTIDLLGLNNTIMAHANTIKQGYRNHASFDKGGFWKLSPDILGAFMGADVVADTSLFVLPENTLRYRTSDITYLCFRGIFDDADFREEYKPALVRNKSVDYFIFGYYKRSFLSKLSDSGLFYIHRLERKPVPLREIEGTQMVKASGSSRP